LVWFDASHSEQPFSISRQVDEVNKRLLEIQPPYFMHRKPRALSQRRHWKASDYRHWVLYYSIPYLSGILEKKFLDHFSRLVEGIYLCLGQRIAKEELSRAKDLLEEFACTFSDLYGSDQHMGLNVHNLLHIVDCVANVGPLWA
jgi:hypothetical protein